MIMNAFNMFDAQLPLLMQMAPIPEPPRVINHKPMVPELSLTSDMSLQISPNKRLKNKSDHRHHNDHHHHHDHHNYHYNNHAPNMNRFMTIYPSFPQSHSPVKGLSSDVNEANPLPHGLRIKDNPLPSKTNVTRQLNRNIIQEHDSHANDEIFQMAVNGKRNKINKYDASVENKNVTNIREPNVIRHAAEPLNKCTNKLTDKQHNYVGTVPSKPTQMTRYRESNAQLNGQSHVPSGEDMYTLLKHQDQQLQKISQQINELLKIHDIKDIRKSPKNVETRSVETMTSVVREDHKNRKTKPLSRSTPKEFRDLRLPIISESPSTPSVDFNVQQLNFTDSPLRSELSNESLEYGRNGDENYYDNIMDDINFMLNNNSIDDSDRRSSVSVTPPKEHNRHHRDNYAYHHRIEMHTEQTLYIKRLAAKYLHDDSHDKEKEKHKIKSLNPHQRVDNRKDLNFYGLPKNASIATKNYLERYGLTFGQSNSPPHVEPKAAPVLHNIVNNKHNHRSIKKQYHNPAKNHILDIESLKRQPKLT